MIKALSQDMSGGNQHSPVIVCVIYSLLFKKIGNHWTPCGKLKPSYVNLAGTSPGADFKNKPKILYTLLGKHGKAKVLPDIFP
jgi:hypothetical protein